ncbi:MAG TPA: MOSC domain-containing protein [Terriglobia bacterium]|nr:MOSC domain-containing protein [Terriglobia bacterium]
MAQGRVEGIFIGSGATAPLDSVPEVRAEQGRGLTGDRYWSGKGTFWKPVADREVTLIEMESLEALASGESINLEAREARRNIATRGLRLNDLVNRRFRIGEATLLGIRLCEPCGHLERLTGKTVRPALAGRGGLRAAVLVSGVIRVGDSIQAEPEPESAAVPEPLPVNQPAG